MRSKLFRQYASISSSSMIVRSRLAGPLRWVLLVLILGLSCLIGLGGVLIFEAGKNIANLSQTNGAEAELKRLQLEVAQLHAEREGALSVTNTAESLVRTAKAAQGQLAQQMKQMEAENLRVKDELAFYERLLPASGSRGLNVRALKAQVHAVGRIKFQALLMNSGKAAPEFVGRYEVVLIGSMDQKPWLYIQPDSIKSLRVPQSLRLEGLIDYPERAAVESVQLKIIDTQGIVKVTQVVKL
jgi:hypothetical protein